MYQGFYRIELNCLERAAQGAGTFQSLLHGLFHDLSALHFVLPNKSVNEIRSLIQIRTFSGQKVFYVTETLINSTFRTKPPISFSPVYACLLADPPVPYVTLLNFSTFPIVITRSRGDSLGYQTALTTIQALTEGRSLTWQNTNGDSTASSLSEDLNLPSIPRQRNNERRGGVRLIGRLHEDGSARQIILYDVSLPIRRFDSAIITSIEITRVSEFYRQYPQLRLRVQLRN